MNWQRKLLKEVVKDWIKGATPNRAHEEYYTNEPGIPLVKVSDLRGRNLQETDCYLTPKGAELDERWVPKGAVLLSVSGTIGKTAIAGVPLKVNQAVQAMVFDETIVLAEYAYYYFQFYRPWLETRANMVTIPNLTKKNLENTYILFPCLKEQKYIVRMLETAEDMIEKQNKTYREAEHILYSMMERKRRISLDGRGVCELRDCIAESIIAIPSGNAGKESFAERYLLRPGNILIRQNPSKKEENYLLVTAETDVAAITGNLLCVSLNSGRLRPEILLGWLRFASRYLGFHTTSVSAFMMAGMEIPEALTGPQDELAHILQRIFIIQDKAKRIAKKAERFYQAMLTASFTAHLAQNYRRRIHLEEADEVFILWHYHAKLIEDERSAARRYVDLDNRYQKGQRKLINFLSDFQKGMLRKYLETEIPMPIHAVLKQLKTENSGVCEGYSIQDAIAAVNILEKLGFLEKTIPEKLYLAESEITDAGGNPITIQKYQAASYEMEA